VTLLRPAALAVLILALPIVALYVLRLRRAERSISSTLLWRGIVEDMRANAPWQRLRLSLLLAVQLLTLAALAIALAEPALSRTQEFAGDVILIVDQSYSMQAADARPTRFAQAQLRARSIGAQLSGTNAVSVIGMGNEPTLAIAQSSDPGAISAAVARLAPGARATNVPAALSLAASLARPGRHTQAVILTDRTTHLSAGSLHLPFPVTIARFGGFRRDLGIVGFAASGGTYTHALARIKNFGRQPASSDLNLYGDGQLLDVRPVSLAAHATTSLAWDHLPAGVQRLEVRLTREDDMAEDKTAWAVVPTIVQRRVLLVTLSDYYLETALALDPTINLQVVPPSGYTPSAASSDDVVIFDGVVPPSLPAASAVFVGPPAGQLPGVRVGSQAAGEGLSGAPRAPAALTRYANLGDVNVARLRRLYPGSRLTTVLRSGPNPAVVVGPRARYREAVVAFSLADTDWPLRISFPVFIHNLMQFLAPNITVGKATIGTGEVLPLFPSPGTRSLQITRPDGATDTVGPPFPPYADTSAPGVYTVRSEPPGVAPAPFAVNAFPPDGTDASVPQVTQTGTEQASSAGRVTVPVDVSWVAGLLVLTLLAAEWWLGMRS
jgi:hypothetical protein